MPTKLTKQFNVCLTGGGTAGAPGQDRRAGEYRRRHRLRVFADSLHAARPPLDHVGEAGSAGRGRSDCHQGTLEEVVKRQAHKKYPALIAKFAVARS